MLGIMSTAAKPAAGTTATTTVTLTSGGRQIRVPITVPAGPTRWRVVLPVIRSITDHVVDSAVARAERAGASISCRTGCAACCRQVVPLAHVEADLLRSRIQQMPKPRRTTVIARFADGRRRLAQAGLLEAMRRPDRVPSTEWQALALQYLALRIDCPFLDRELCSIYPDRPLACREYLVTTPAQHCWQPTAATVACVPLTVKPCNALMRAARVDADGPAWTPLILAHGPDAHPVDPQPRPGPELVQSFLNDLRSAAAPDPSASGDPA